MDEIEIKKVVETLLFISDQPLPLERISQIINLKENKIQKALRALEEDYKERTFQIMNIAGGYQMATRQEYSLWIRRLYNNRMTVRLSAAALETLSIIAYKQPITRAEVEAIRGVEVIGPLETLLERRLITTVGRKESVGRPLLYGTTKEFLRQFGLNSLDNLPDINTLIDKEATNLGEQAMQGKPHLSEDAMDGLSSVTEQAMDEKPSATEQQAMDEKPSVAEQAMDDKPTLDIAEAESDEAEESIAEIQEKKSDDVNNKNTFDDSTLSEDVADDNSSIDEEEAMVDKLEDIIEDGDDSSSSEEKSSDDKPSVAEQQAMDDKPSVAEQAMDDKDKEGR